MHPEQVIIERYDHARLVQVQPRSQRLAKRQPQPFKLRVARQRLVLIPARLGVRRQQALLHIRHARTGRCFAQDGEARAAPLHLAEIILGPQAELLPRHHLARAHAAVDDLAAALGVIHLQDARLRKCVGRALLAFDRPRRRVRRVAFDLDGPPVKARHQQPLRHARKFPRGRILLRHARHPPLRIGRIGRELLLGPPPATRQRQPRHRQRRAHQLEEPPARRPGGHHRRRIVTGELLRQQLAHFRRVRQLLEAAPVPCAAMVMLYL